MGVKKFRWKGKKIITFSIVCVVIIGIVAGVFAIRSNTTKSTVSEQRTTKVTKGDINVSITGSGTITSANTSNLMSNVAGKVTKAYCKEGDAVKKGQLLYEIDDTDQQYKIQQIDNSISQAQLNAGNSEKGYKYLTVTAPFSGKVTQVKAVEGENVNNGMNLFTITDTSKLKLTVPVGTSYIPYIKVGQKVDVNMEKSMDTLEGVITAIDNNSYTYSDGGVVKNVTVSVDNPGTLTDSNTANVTIKTSKGDLDSSELKFEYNKTKTVTSGTSGTFSTVNIEENQFVKQGSVLIKIENDDLQITSETNSLKMTDLENQLTTAKKALEDYKVYAPFDGTISAVTAKTGDSLERGGALLSIRDFNQMQFTISVDELDISKVKVGQEVSITVDALTDTEKTPLSGEVIYKAMEGTSSNGVATYNVTIKINETKNLLAGMNANATIILEKSQNALLVPLEAVTKMGDKSFVWVKGSSSGSQQTANASGSGNMEPSQTSSSDAAQSSNSRSSRRSSSSSSSRSSRIPASVSQYKEYYANATRKEVEIGLTSDTYIEIKSGLSEGDEVILPPLVKASNSASSSSSSKGFSMGGMAGGMGNDMGGPPDMQRSGSSSSRNNSGSNSQKN